MGLKPKLNKKRLSAVQIIILVNVLVFLAWVWQTNTTPEPIFMIDHFLVSWEHLAEGRVWTLLTSVFSHNMFWHILLNMFVLNSFGPVLEDILGVRGTTPIEPRAPK